MDISNYDIPVIITTAPCMLCHESSTIELTDTEYDALKRNEYIQVALPTRDDDFRELVMTGTHSECWDKMLPEED